MTRYKAGDIVLVRFPFTDLTTTKKRPGLVISPSAFAARQGDIVVLAITSQPQKDARPRLTRWRTEGLAKPSWVKPVIGTLVPNLVLRRLGRLHIADRAPVRYALRQLIAGGFLK